MELLVLNKENIEQYLAGCVQLQEHLGSPTATDPLQVRATAEEANNYFLALKEEDTIVGVGVLSKIVHPVTSNGYINNIVVSPEFRGRGYFSVIMDELERKAKDWGCSRVDLTCSREEVQKLYEKRGYIQKKTNFYILKF